DERGQFILRAFQFLARTMNVARIGDSMLTKPSEIRQRVAQRRRPCGGARPTLIPRNAFIASKSEQANAGGRLRRPRLHALMDAKGFRTFHPGAAAAGPTPQIR